MSFADDGEIGTREYYRNMAEKMSRRIKSLEQQLEDAKQIGQIREEVQRNVEGLVREVEMLRSALEKYGMHLPTCPALKERRLIPFPSASWNKCTCGLGQALKGE